MRPELQKLPKPQAVTFDCWCTLIVDNSPDTMRTQRIRFLARTLSVEEAAVSRALSEAWIRHSVLWHRRQVFGATDMTRLVLERLGFSLDGARLHDLIEALEGEALHHSVAALAGARITLERLAEQGIRLALICDTGFSPGRVVRKLLDRVGLLDLLEVLVFSDEVGVPKPHPRAFFAALNSLGVAPSETVHVGDLRRSDIAGAKGVGMRSVRLIAHHDDAAPKPERSSGIIDCTAAGCTPQCATPEADAIAESHAHLLDVLGFN